MPAPLLGWYGDDFTGATDTLAVLTQAGLRAILFMGVPTARQQAAAEEALGGALHAVGIAGASRSMAPAAMEAELASVGAFFEALGGSVLHYKVCSTFDSAPGIGNIATAVSVLRRHVRNSFVPIVGGQPSLGRYCAFSNLFAAAGSGGAVERIDRHPTMSKHPTTPMREADLRRHLALQGMEAVAAIHCPVYAQSHAAQLGILQGLLNQRPAAILLDLVDAAQLSAIGRMVWEQALQGPLLAVGASSVAQALVAHWNEIGLPESGSARRSSGTSHALVPADSAVFVFAGSLSPITATQVGAASSFDHVALDAARLLDGTGYANDMRDKISQALLGGRHVLAYTAPAEAATADTSKSPQLAQATAHFVNAIVHGQAARGKPLRRIGIAGGDTSSLAVQQMGVWGLSYRASLGAGVAISSAHSDNPALDGLELMLKGGQMGGEDVFERLLDRPHSAVAGSMTV